LRKKRKKKRGKFFTKARKLRNRLSRRKLVRKIKRAAKKAVLTVKKATVKQATKKASNAAKAAVKQVKKNETAQNLKLVSMGLNYIPVFGNIKALYEMATGKDMITGQKVVIPKGGSKYINLENSCPMPQNKGKTKKEKEREIIDKFIEEQRNHEKKVLKFAYNFFFEDIETMLSPDSSLKERAEAAFYTFYKPAKMADTAKDGAKIIESQAERIKKNVDESARARDSSKFDDYARKEKEITGNKGTGNIGNQTRDQARHTAQNLLKNGEVSMSNLESMIPSNIPNTFKPTDTITDGAKYEFTLADGQKAIIRWHSPDPVAASKYPGSASGARWTTQIKIGNKQLKSDGTWTKNQSLNEVHIPIEGK
ncbi:pre-toxin TG domain-containing protein, partial [Lysinibacillus sp. NPDC093688]|uniref:pre-toxin TG domain-containing protein n=1 Tax=Lysinibacillus sp. NPDC093688 TaxID=3390577 RepID=UPI003D0591EF